MLPFWGRSQSASAPDPQPPATPGEPDPRADSSFAGSEDPFSSAALEAALGAATVKEGAKELPSAGLRVSWCCASVPAVSIDGEKAESLDTVLVEPDFAALDGSRAVLLGVLDGHGESGGRVAAYVRDALPTQLISVSDTASLAEAFLRTDEMLTVSGVPALGRSGASACVLSLCDADASCRMATVGDARALLGRRDGGAGSLSAEQLNTAHTPELKAEYDRCVEAGARIMSRRQLEKKAPWVGTWDGDVAGIGAKPGEEDRPRIYSREAGAPGTTLSRAFGVRQAKALGVVAGPDTCRIELCPPHRYLIAATAGVFDCLSNDEAVAVVAAAAEAKGGTPRTACLALAAEAARQALMRNGGAAPAVSVALFQLLWGEETEGGGGATVNSAVSVRGVNRAGSAGVCGAVDEPEPSSGTSDYSFSWLGDYDAFSTFSSQNVTAPPSRLQSPSGSANASAPGTSPASPKHAPAPHPPALRFGNGEGGTADSNTRADVGPATTRLPLTLTSTKRAAYVPPPGIGPSATPPPGAVPPAGIAGRPASPLKGARERAHEALAGRHAAAMQAGGHTAAIPVGGPSEDASPGPSPTRSSFRRSRTSTPPPPHPPAPEPKARENKRLSLPLALPWQKRPGQSAAHPPVHPAQGGSEAPLILPIALHGLARSNSRASESNSARLNPDLPLSGSPFGYGHPLSPIQDSSPFCITPRSAAAAAAQNSSGSTARNSNSAQNSYFAQNSSAFASQNSPATGGTPAVSPTLTPTASPAAGRALAQAAGLARPTATPPLLAQASDAEDEPRGAALRPAAPDSVRLGCFLKRCGLLRKAWKTRWAAIDAGQLLYYSDAACTTCRGALPLPGASIEPELFDAATAPRGFGPCHGFRVTAGGRTIRGFPHLGLGAQTGDVGMDADIWLGKLREAAEAEAGADTAGGAAEAADTAGGAEDTAGSAADTAGEDRFSVGTGCSLGETCGVGGCPVEPETTEPRAHGNPAAAGMHGASIGAEPLPPPAGVHAGAHPPRDTGGEGSGHASASPAPAARGTASWTAADLPISHSAAALHESLSASQAAQAELQRELDEARAALLEREVVWRAQAASLSERIDAGRRVEAELRAQLRDAHDDVARARLASPRSRSLSPRGSTPNVLQQNRSSHRGNSGRVALVKNAFETGTKIKTPRGDRR